ncbi:MAG: glycosyltransferase [Planctomycetaceae bacterium]|nr:glycosyltransferase [Planctomycetaceae bacterium]MCB9950738.1 glycosyltransferase [Planctomycetaceae bacterium]
MRYLFISTTFPDAANPARGTYNSALCRALAERHEVRVISPRMFTEVLLRQTSRTTPANIRDAGIRAEYPTYWYTPKFWQEYYGDQMWWSVRRLVDRTLKEFQPDAVLSYFAHPDGQVGLQAAQQMGIPSAVIVGGSDVLVLPNHPKRGQIVRRVLHETTRIITVSDGLREKCIELGCAPDAVRTIYQGVETDVFFQADKQAARAERNIPQDAEVLVWVGRMVSIKGLDLLIDAFQRVCAQRPQARLYLLGDGPSRQEVEQQAKRLGIEDKVTCIGSVGHDQIADWYRAADLCVLSSHSEGLPNVLRESLACGTPFVSTDVGSIREIADEKYSLLVQERDPQQFANAIEHGLQENYRDAAASFTPRTWNNCADEVQEMFGELFTQNQVTTQAAPLHSREKVAAGK